MNAEDMLAIEKAKFRLECFKAVTPSRGDLPNHLDMDYYVSKAQALFDWCVTETPSEAEGPAQSTKKT